MRKIVYLFIFLFTYSAYSQSLSLYNIDVSNFPTIKADLIALDNNGNQISNLSPSDFTLSENNQLRIITNINCPDPYSRPAVSSVLVFDMSGSMKQGPPRIESAKKAANAWIKGLPLGKSECALVSFSDYSYIVRDFTTNRQLLETSIESFTPTANTNYNQALITPPCGGLQVAKAGKHKKVIIFLTDGLPNFVPNTEEIISFAKQYGITIYAVTLDMPAPQCIKDMTYQTGGQYFENITTQNEAEETYLKLLNLAQGYNPCHIEWESAYNCNTGIINVELKNNSLNEFSRANYILPDYAIPRLEFNPAYINFGKVIPGKQKDTIIKITAYHTDFTNINVVSNNPIFTVNPQVFSISKGQSIDLKVSYTPVDSGYAYTQFSFEGGICNFNYYVYGGFPGVRPKNSSLKLVQPNGGEVYISGCDTLIKWEGISNIDTVKIELSIDNGLNWKTLTSYGKELNYLWKNVPKPESYQCKIRITHHTEYGSEKKAIEFYLKGHTNVVNRAVWSPDGSRVATASLDNQAIIWDAFSGKALFTLNGHSAAINDLSWSPDGGYVATAGKDSLAIIWNVTSGEAFQILKDHKNRVESLSWSPDGSHLVTAGWDSTAIVWDVVSGSKTLTLKSQKSRLDKVSWSPNGSKIATSTNDDETIIWDAITGNKIKTITGIGINWNPYGNCLTTQKFNEIRIWDAQTGNLTATANGLVGLVQDISWSPDGNKFVAVGNDKSAKIFDTATGMNILNLVGHSAAINTVSWSPDGKRIATGSNDKIAMIWNANNGSRLNELKGHNEYITDINWSPDGFRVATGSSDNNAYIWITDSLQISLQQDESDQVFSIVTSKATASDINMKQCLIGSIKDSIISNYITNAGLYKLEVKSVTFGGTDADVFKLGAGVPNEKLNQGERKSIEICFIPKRAGIHTAEITIITQSDTLIRNISGEGVEPQLQILSNMLDFGKVELGDEKTLQDTILIKNIVNQSIFISNVNLLGPDTTQFKIIDGGNSFTLQAGESRKMTIRFKPIYGGRTSSQLGFEFHSIGSPAIVNLFGTGIGGSVYIKNDSAIAGKKLSLKIVMENVKPEGIAAIAPNFEAKIRFQKTIIAPLIGADWNVINDSTYIKIKGTIGFSNELAQIPIISCLGNVEETYIDIIEFYLVDNLGNKVDYNFEKQSGLFKLLGICREGGTRLFNPTGKAEILSIMPNPASEDVEIKVNLIEDGATLVSIYNSNGMKIKEYNINGETGQKTINLNAKDFSNGLYFIQLQTPTVLENQKLMIIK